MWCKRKGEKINFQHVLMFKFGKNILFILGFFNGKTAILGLQSIAMTVSYIMHIKLVLQTKVSEFTYRHPQTIM